jgi:hypothetical protein
MKYYYKRYWEETTGEKLTDSWGTSTYYFETDIKLNVLRQIQVFENDKTLKYSSEILYDKYGQLTDQPLDEEDYKDFLIDSNEFEKIWSNNAKKTWWKFW